MNEKLTALTLRNALWDVFQKTRHGEMAPGTCLALSSAGMTTIRSVRVQLQTAFQAGRQVPADALEFAGL